MEIRRNIEIKGYITSINPLIRIGLYARTRAKKFPDKNRWENQGRKSADD